MDSSANTILVNVNLEIDVEALEAVVANAKKMDSQGAGGARLDTADTLSLMISKFLWKENFSRFVKNSENYSPQA